MGKIHYLHIKEMYFIKIHYLHIIIAICFQQPWKRVGMIVVMCSLFILNEIAI